MQIAWRLKQNGWDFWSLTLASLLLCISDEWQLWLLSFPDAGQSTHLICSVSADSCRCLIMASDRQYKMEEKTRPTLTFVQGTELWIYRDEIAPIKCLPPVSLFKHTGTQACGQASWTIMVLLEQGSNGSRTFLISYTNLQSPWTATLPSHYPSERAHYLLCSLAIDGGMLFGRFYFYF